MISLAKYCDYDVLKKKKKKEFLFQGVEELLKIKCAWGKAAHEY